MWKTIAIFILGGIIGSGIGYYVGYDIGFEDNTRANISSFAECVAAGNAVMESYPRQCRDQNGQLFIEENGIQPVPPTEVEGVFCTLDAMVCPDGSSVGRIPPACEFAPCPGE